MPKFKYIVSLECSFTRDEANYIIDCADSNWETKHYLCEGEILRGVINQLKNNINIEVSLEIDQSFIDILINKVIAYHNIPSKKYDPELVKSVGKKLNKINDMIDAEIIRINKYLDWNPLLDPNQNTNCKD